MKRPLSATCAAVMFSATLFAAQYDRLLDAIYVPDGAYFDTGYVVKDNPLVISVSRPRPSTTRAAMIPSRNPRQSRH